MTIDTLGSSFDTLLAVYTGESMNGLTLVEANDDIFGGNTVQSQVAFPAVAGTVIERTANVGLNVDSGTPVFTVADLSTVWVMAELHEQNFALVRVGTNATVTLPAYPGVQLSGRVSYLDPQVTSETRTGKVRVELQNARQLLRLGMYADVVLSAPQARGQSTNASVTVPRAAVQMVGQRSVVYVVHSEGQGRFVEREVALGPTIGERAQVLSGLKVGESIVVEGSFFLRAESERLGLRQSSPSSPEGR